MEEGLIEHHGWIDDVRPHCREASSYDMPSYREGTQRTVLEAMAMGRPIITTETPGRRAEWMACPGQRSQQAW